jgi:hypothetical protein
MCPIHHTKTLRIDGADRRVKGSMCGDTDLPQPKSRTQPTPGDKET